MIQLSVVPVVPRRLTDREAEILRTVLSAEFAGAEQLRTQVSHTEVVATWGEGSPSVDLRVTPGCAPANIVDGEVPVDAQVHDDEGNYIGEITVWTTSGYLSAIEYGWVTDTRPDELPSPWQLKVLV